MNSFTFIAFSKELHSSNKHFAIHDGSKNVSVKYVPEGSSSYGKTQEHIIIGRVTVLRDMTFNASAYAHLAEVVYAVEVARFVWPLVDQHVVGGAK